VKTDGVISIRDKQYKVINKKNEYSQSYFNL